MTLRQGPRRAGILAAGGVTRPPAAFRRGASRATGYDALTGEWVAVAAHRQTRTHLPPADQCPICPTTPANPSEIPAPDYDVVVFENRFPSSVPPWDRFPPTPGWGLTGTASGRCEVVAFNPTTPASFSGLSAARGPGP